MIPRCPQCNQVIDATDINVGKDLAYCRPCNAAHALSDLFEQSMAGPPVDLGTPPHGVRCETGAFETTIEASHRSWGQALALLGVALFWNGIVSLFVAFALFATLKKMGIGLPDWFPEFKSEGRPIGTGELIFLWLFLTPFIAIGTWLATSFVSTVIGKTRVCIGQDAGSVFVGVGRLGWTRRFDPAAVRRIEIVHRDQRSGNGHHEIHLEHADGKKIAFGSLLKEERQHFIVSALRQFILGTAPRP